jgi:O-antigen/teichoic acid export membrane protein
MERYGIWMTITSFSAYIMILDFGISTSSVNKLTYLYSTADIDSANTYVTSALVILGGVAVSCMLISLAVIPAIDWGNLFKLSSTSIRQEAIWSITIAVLMFFVQLPLSLILKVPYTMQTGWLSETYQVAGTMIALSGTFLGVLAGTGLPLLVFFLTSSSLFASLGLLTHLLTTKKFRLTVPSFAEVDKCLQNSWSSGLDFMLLQAVSLLMNSLQLTLLAVYHGAGAVAQYGLMTQIVIAIQVPFSVLLQPMWTKMAQLVYQSEFEGVKSMFIRYLKCAFVYAVAASCVMFFLLNPIMEVVLRKHVFFPVNLRIAFAVACSLGLVAGGGVGVVLLALNLSRAMAAMALFQLLAFLCSVVTFVPSHGAVAMISSISVTYLISIPISFWFIRKSFREYAMKSSQWKNASEGCLSSSGSGV